MHSFFLSFLARCWEVWKIQNFLGPLLECKNLEVYPPSFDFSVVWITVGVIVVYNLLVQAWSSKFLILKKMLLLFTIIFFCCYISSLAFTCSKYHRHPTCIYDNNIEKSLENARKNIIERKSPGAGLATAGACLFICTSIPYLLNFYHRWTSRCRVCRFNQYNNGTKRYWESF